MPAGLEGNVIQPLPGETREEFIVRLRDLYYRMKEEKVKADEKKRRAAYQRPGRLRAWVHYTNYVNALLVSLYEKLHSLGETL